jgi:hypothetical protein
MSKKSQALQVIHGAADLWWTDLVMSELSQAGDLGEVDKRLMRRWPNGPASHPRVLAVVRKYWLACDALNEVIAGETYPDEAEPGPEPEYVLAPEAGPEEDTKQPEEEDEDSEEDEVDPHIFVLEWLIDDDHDDLAGFLTSLTYWPVGLDRDDRYT